MINAYFNQKLQWKKRTGVNDYNEPTYEVQEYAFINQTLITDIVFVPTYDFPCRVEFKRRMVRGNGAQQLISDVTIFTSAAIRADDIVVYDGVEHLVLTTSPQFDLQGNVLWYEGSL